MSTTLTARQTRSREYQYHHNIEMNENNLQELGVSEGERVVVRNNNNSAEPACYGRIHRQDDFEDDEFGLGYTLRYAIGAPESTEVTIEPLPSEVSDQTVINSLSDYVFGSRPVICRVRMAVEPDPGFRVCRITSETKELLGINSGDRVVIESAEGKARDVKALPQSGNSVQIKESQKTQHPVRYPSCFDIVGIEGVRGTKVDIPEIYVDKDIREDLKITDKTNEGVCQPVVVSRDTTDLFGRVFLDIATPLIIGAVAAAIGFESAIIQGAFNLGIYTVLALKVSLLILALLIAIIAVWYRTRIVLLD